MDPRKLPRCLQKYAEEIAEVSDERRDGDGYWVYLAYGYRDHEGETHCLHEDTPEKCAKLMPLVKRCTEPGCCEKLPPHEQGG